jgi:hypothetical protein
LFSGTGRACSAKWTGTKMGVRVANGKE